MISEKKLYETPNLVAFGSVESLTKNLRSSGSGDLFTAIANHLGADLDDNGCYFDNSPICQSTGSF